MRPDGTTAAAREGTNAWKREPGIDPARWCLRSRHPAADRTRREDVQDPCAVESDRELAAQRRSPTVRSVLSIIPPMSRSGAGAAPAALALRSPKRLGDPVQPTGLVPGLCGSPCGGSASASTGRRSRIGCGPEAARARGEAVPARAASRAPLNRSGRRQKRRALPRPSLLRGYLNLE
jgi:hypothetical protein